MSALPSDLEIARAARIQPIGDIAAAAGVNADALEQYGRYKAKIDPARLAAPEPHGKVVLVSAMSPTPAGEGKSTTTVGLADSLARAGHKVMIALREPSLGPVLGMKGGATGGGYSQVLPMDEINLHFTGDFHAITSANNLLAAMIDNHVYWGNKLDIDTRRVTWRRSIDMNDRALREIVSSLGGVANGFPREAGFDITVASEVMAIFCLASDLADLQRRLGQIQIGQTRDRKAVTASGLSASGSMAALLKDALAPNLVQTLENNPAFIHGGPFANIAHGCNSVIATKAALKLGDYVVTEAGFGADLGAEKFFDIKCRKAGLKPDCAVLVATIRALKMHGGVAKDNLKKEDLDALEKGFANLERHVQNLRRYDLPVIVAVNRFSTDTEAEVALLTRLCATLAVECVLADHWAEGGAGAVELARTVVRTIETRPSDFHPLYPDDLPLWEKTRLIAQQIYGAADITADKTVKDRFAELEKEGFGKFPICVAKTQYSFTTNPDVKGSPSGHVIPIREVRLSAGAEFVVVICGDIMTMPGLPKVPAANNIELGPDGRIGGLF
jgi:formate--tetrahydrofolate ligase